MQVVQHNGCKMVVVVRKGNILSVIIGICRMEYIC